MILHKIGLYNFGIFGGLASFDLTPQPDQAFNRPLTLFRGKNGVGKSTLVEAIRLCLHGSLALGSRISQRELEEHLIRRLHRSADGSQATEAFIRLSFEFVALGRRTFYEVTRSWELRRERLHQTLHIREDGTPLRISSDEYELFLRDLISPGLVDLFFFDGEKIATLAEAGEEGGLLLADTVKNLLGLNLVEQLDRDLDVFLTRQKGIHELHYHQIELDALLEQDEALRQDIAENREALAECRQRMATNHSQINKLEQQIASAGGTFAKKQKAQQRKGQQLESSIAAQKQQIQEICRGALPFAVAPKILHKLRQRLHKEAAFRHWELAQDVIRDLGQKMAEASDKHEFWEGVAEKPDAAGRKRHQERINSLLDNYRQPPMQPEEVIHRPSAEQRGRLLAWIEEAQSNAPKQLAKALHDLKKLQEEVTIVKAALAQVPAHQIIEPMQQELRQLERKMGRLELKLEQLRTEEARLAFHLERNAGGKRRISEQIANINADDGRAKLAAKTKLLLDSYQQQVTQRKLSQLETLLARRFNLLCRKPNFIGRVGIDPKSFSVILFRSGKPFRRRQLSAGEQQLFAIATLWALREVSGLPMPVLVDTPLSRLDSEHRHSMIADFFPQVAHQVIIFATDAEIDEQTVDFLRPAISHAYSLAEDIHTGSIDVKKASLPSQHSFIGLEEVQAYAV